ncbi:MAG: cyclic nucleotide-binding domain-containing protein [Deltaproteobacteria bacterium]|nr:cyclic nucleotide-binding domain-containing protein [Deltaproteobacteria bacterium]
MSQITLQHAGRTDVGIVRSNNEDAFLIDDVTRLFVVCDGVGGRQGGEVASRTAAEYIANRIREHADELEAVHSGDARLNKRNVAAWLENAISDASGAVREKAASDPSLAGMATTVVAALVVGSQAFVAHVGDSRVYLVRHKTLHQLTEDHSVMNDLRRRGAQADRSHLGAAFQGALTRALGVLNTARVDMLDFELLPGDRLLLCSDGVSGVIGDTTMQAIAPHGDATGAVHMFIDTALQNGAPDNATIVIVDISQEAAEDRVSQVRRRLEALQAISMFRYLPYPDLMRVASVAKEMPFSAGTTIFDEGAPGDSLFVILEGHVGVIKSQLEIAELGEGAHFGEMSLIERVPRSAGIVAKTSVRALVIEREGFFSLLREEVTAVKLLWGMVRMLNQRLRSTSDELTMIKTMYGIEG